MFWFMFMTVFSLRRGRGFPFAARRRARAAWVCSNRKTVITKLSSAAGRSVLLADFLLGLRAKLSELARLARRIDLVGLVQVPQARRPLLAGALALGDLAQRGRARIGSRQPAVADRDGLVVKLPLAHAEHEHEDSRGRRGDRSQRATDVRKLVAHISGRHLRVRRDRSGRFAVHTRSLEPGERKWKALLAVLGERPREDLVLRTERMGLGHFGTRLDDTRLGAFAPASIVNRLVTCGAAETMPRRLGIVQRQARGVVCIRDNRIEDVLHVLARNPSKADDPSNCFVQRRIRQDLLAPLVVVHCRRRNTAIAQRGNRCQHCAVLSSCRACDRSRRGGSRANGKGERGHDGPLVPPSFAPPQTRPLKSLFWWLAQCAKRPGHS